MLSWADALFASARLDPSCAQPARAVFDDMRQLVMAGQYLDVLVQARGAFCADDALRVIEFKTSKYTVERPLHLGAALGGAPPAVIETLTAYGLPLGEAFQLRDDVLGVFGDPSETGKPAGDDLREGKRTLLAALALHAADQRQAAVLRAGLGDRALTAEGVAKLRALLVATGAVDEVEHRIAARATQALAAIAGPSGDCLNPRPARRSAGSPTPRPPRGVTLVRTVAGRTDTVVVVGAGLGGLSAALHLAGAGRQVTVVERADRPGGRCGLLETGGYRFDTGPTVLTIPDLLARPLHAVGEQLCDWLTCSASTPPTGRTSPTARPSTCAPTPPRWPRRSPAPAGAATPTGSCVTSPSCASCTASRCRTSSTATSTRRCSWQARRWSGWWRSAGSGGWPRSSPTT